MKRGKLDPGMVMRAIPTTCGTRSHRPATGSNEEQSTRQGKERGNEKEAIQMAQHHQVHPSFGHEVMD